MALYELVGMRPHALLAAEAARLCSGGDAGGDAEEKGARGRGKRASTGRMGSLPSGKAAGGKGGKGKKAEAAASRMGEVGGDEDEDGFGFLSSERMHTLKSFQAYAKWAKAKHFGLPLGRPRAAQTAAPPGHAAAR
jgi:hypothetical protein